MPQKRKKSTIDNKELKLSKEYLYGALFYRDSDNYNHTFFINNNVFNYYNNKDNQEINIDNNEQINELKKVFENRLFYIYEPDNINPDKDINLFNIYNKIKNGGSPYNIKLPNITNDFSLNKDMKTNYKKLFKLPDENYNLNYFFEEFNKPTNGGYAVTTLDIMKVQAIFLCYFHIDNFEITNNFRQYDVSDILNKENLEIPNKNNNYNNDIIIKKTQEYVYPSNIIQTVYNIYELSNNIENANKLYPINVDVEYEEIDNGFKRNYFLADGNHRIYALKRLGYNGYVPCICFDYLPNELISNKK